MIKIHITNLKNQPKISKRKLKEVATKVLVELHKANREYEINVILVDDAYIQKLNKKYRKVDLPTDVLVFPIGEIPTRGKGKLKFMGDIYISTDRVAQQVQKDETLETEVQRLLIHGLLHLVGYEHSEQMFYKQEYLLSQLSDKFSITKSNFQ